MTERERIDRATLLKRAAAVAGAVYVTPVLTASSAGSVDACAGQPCRRNRKCRRKGGVDCRCVEGRCRSAPCWCPHASFGCGYLIPCGDNCACYPNGHRELPGRCIYLEDGNCETFFRKHGACPSGDDSECPEGKVCWAGCCEDFGYPHLCAECCDGRSGSTLRLPATGGPMIAWL
jgi:hypothetical protein